MEGIRCGTWNWPKVRANMIPKAGIYVSAVTQKSAVAVRDDDKIMLAQHRGSVLRKFGVDMYICKFNSYRLATEKARRRGRNRRENDGHSSVKCLQ